jgi:CDP-diacylglycerol--serine O-phosphatidyltransferase
MAVKHAKNRGFRSVSLFWLIPNMLTVAGLVSGLTALKFALDGRWAGVIVLVALAAVFDALDGRTARRFKTSSAFGAALDSLSDLVVFGVVPALCLYLWALQDSGRVAWWATLFYAVSIALRLARFDSELPNPPEYAKDYFTGIPAPASGFLVLMPICVELEFQLGFVREPAYVSAWLVLIGAGAVSAIPTFAGKRLKLPGLDGASGVGVGRFADGWFGDPALDHISRDHNAVCGQYSSRHCPFLSGAGAGVWVIDRQR